MSGLIMWELFSWRRTGPVQVGPGTWIQGGGMSHSSKKSISWLRCSSFAPRRTSATLGRRTSTRRPTSATKADWFQIDWRSRLRAVAMTNDAETGGVSRWLFHRRWSDGKGRTLDPNADVPVTEDRAARLLCGGCGWLAGWWNPRSRPRMKGSKQVYLIR